jgi:hypothetical protein
MLQLSRRAIQKSLTPTGPRFPDITWNSDGLLTMPAMTFITASFYASDRCRAKAEKRLRKFLEEGHTITLEENSILSEGAKYLRQELIGIEHDITTIYEWMFDADISRNPEFRITFVRYNNSDVILEITYDDGEVNEEFRSLNGYHFRYIKDNAS